MMRANVAGAESADWPDGDRRPRRAEQVGWPSDEWPSGHPPADEWALRLLAPALRRRWEAVIFDWVATAAIYQRTGMWALRTLVRAACDVGLDLVVLAASPGVPSLLGAQPRGPGRLLYCQDDPPRREASPRASSGRRDRDQPPDGAEIMEMVGDTLVSRHRVPAGALALDWVLAELWEHGIAAGSVACIEGPAAVPHPGGQPAHVTEPGAELTVVSGGPKLLRVLLADQIHRRLRADVDTAGPAPGWGFTIDSIDPSLIRVHESLLTLADGRLGTRGTPVAATDGATPAVFYSGVYEGTGPQSELARLPLWNRIDPAQTAQEPPSRRVLDLHTGVLYEEGRFASVRFSSLARPGTVALRVRLAAADGSAAGESAAGPLGGRVEHSGAVHTTIVDRPRGAVLERLGAYDPDPAAARAALTEAEAAGFEALLSEHRQAWARRWREADVVVEGDPQLQRAVRLALFHLMASVADEGEAAVGARGLSGPAYRGHVFWDSDVFILPFLAATHPPAARAMLEYRVRRLPAARAEAKRLGREGARFPWESAADGTDVTPPSAHMPTGETVRIRTGEMEEHIVACVAWAANCYGEWTADPAFTAGVGAELLADTARYWASRVRLDDAGMAHIDGVVGPDEYHHGVDDNAFTNVMARWNLRRASALPGIDDAERDSWLRIAASLVDGYDRRTGLYEQFAGFYGLTPIVIAEIAPRRPVAADLLLGTDRTARSQVVKQSDVLMLHHLVPDEVAPGSLAPNLDFYEPRTAHGSSLSPAIHAALLARAGRIQPALAWLRIASRIDLDDLTGTTAGGLHLATMGGLWQALAYGFAGIRVHSGHLMVRPHLPPSWRALEVGLRFHGEPLRLRMSAGTVEIDSDRFAIRRSGPAWEVAPG